MAGSASRRRTHARPTVPESAWPPQIVVLGGGLGSRIEPLAGGLPKSLVPILGEPFVHHQLRLLASQGIREVVYVIGFRGEQVRSAVGDGREFGLAVSYVDEGDQLHGTGGALRVARDAGPLEDVFGVVYGDSYLPVDLGPIWAAFDSSGRPALMTVLRNNDLWDRSNALFEDGRVVMYDKRIAVRDTRMQWIDYGLSVLRREVVETIPTGAICDLADLYRDLSLRGDLAGFEVATRFFEVGSPDGVAALESHLRSSARPRD
jgi:NDP-sugar pyrophosphorylase family protein